MSTDTQQIMNRDFATDDRGACIEIFKALTPEYFREEELDDFVAFLDKVDGETHRYGVIVNEEDRIIGCGGMIVDPEKQVATMCWEMVHPEFQRQGIGSFMFMIRRGWASEHPDIHVLLGSASYKTASFFASKGFKTFDAEYDFFGPGQHLHYMKLFV